MPQTLAEFAAACRRILAADAGPTGRLQVCALVRDVLKDETFIATHLPDGAPERNILYEDPELGFCILGHVYEGARESAPHDHGPSWAIYGQARGETVMSDWEIVERPRAGEPGRVRHARAYRLTPGMAHVYHEGEVHSPRRDGLTRLIRIEGRNMDKVGRTSFTKVS